MVEFLHQRKQQIESTNDEVRRLAQRGAAADCFVISAESQTKGRGRSGRHWVSPKGNLHCSILVDIAGNLQTAAQVSFVAAVAVAETLQMALPQAISRIKWPNDVLLGTDIHSLGKGCGMLLEAENDRWLIVGIGVNVCNTPPATEALYPPQSLKSLGYNGTDMTLLDDLMGHFCHWLKLWRQDGFSPILARWRELAHGIGQPITVRLEKQTLEGIFVGIDDHGGLILDQKGKRQTILAGDVFFS